MKLQLAIGRQGLHRDLCAGLAHLPFYVVVAIRLSPDMDRV
jgi:hypothetical protein